MKFLFLLFTSLLTTYSFGQTKDSTFIKEDEIIQKIECGQPSELLIRFGKDRINLFGKWCYISMDSNYWTLSKAEFGSLISNCNGMLFHYYGKVREHIWGDFFGKEPTIKYDIKDSILEINIFKNESLIKTESYTIVKFTGQEITLKKLKSTLTSNNLNWIFGSLAFKTKTIETSNKFKITYSTDSCYIIGKDYSEKEKWRIDLKKFNCELIYFKAVSSKTKNCDIIFQLKDNRIFGINSKSGNMLPLEEKDVKQ